MERPCAKALQELSAPLIPVLEGITVMPLIGTIDTERAKQIMENLLTGVVKHRSEVVLIDITGVPVVDTMVAHHIIQAVSPTSQYRRVSPHTASNWTEQAVKRITGVCMFSFLNLLNTSIPLKPGNITSN